MRKALFLAALPLLINCAHDADAPDRCGAFSVLTYNAGLGPGMVALSSPRAPFVAAAVSALEDDMICLQEIWTARDADAIAAALGLPAANVVVLATGGLQEAEEDRCAPADLAPVMACVSDRCAGVPDEETTICALDECETDLAALYLARPHCLHCLAASAGRSADAIADVCATTGATRVHGGRNGVILASRHPVANAEGMLLPAGNANRAALFATIELPGAGPVEVACTHFSASQQIPPAHSGYADWRSEKLAQLRMVSERLGERAGGRPQLLVGDMNFGRANGSEVRESSIDAWNEAAGLGFASPAADADPPFCSSCGDNTLKEPSSGGTLIDHVMVRDPGAIEAVDVERLLDASVSIVGYDGSPVTSHLSDHYAVRVTFSVR